MIPVSICIIAKNEEKYIGECLKRLTKYGMEIIVTDTGSTDRTKEIASRYASKVLDFQWVEDFSAARNFCAENASNNWILALDCDEYVENIDVPKLRMCMQKFPKKTGIVKLRNAAYRYDGTIGYTDEDIVRFYNRNFYEFAYPVHENIVARQGSGGGSECFEVPMKIVHMGYLVSGDEMKQKQERNLKLLYQSAQNEKVRNAYTFFQIAQSEHILGNLENAIDNYKKCLEIEKNTELSYVQTCVIELATTYAQMDEPQKAVEVLEQYQDRIKTAQFTYTYGLALLGIEQPLKALMQLVLASLMDDSDKLGENLVYCYEQIIRLYQMFGQPQMAEPFRQKYEEHLHHRQRMIEQIKGIEK